MRRAQSASKRTRVSNRDHFSIVGKAGAKSRQKLKLTRVNLTGREKRHTSSNFSLEEGKKTSLERETLKSPISKAKSKASGEKINLSCGL